MAERRKIDLAAAGREMDEVGDVLFIIDHICAADIVPLKGTFRDALATLARMGSAKLDKARAVIEAMGEAHG